MHSTHQLSEKAELNSKTDQHSSNQQNKHLQIFRETEIFICKQVG